MGILRNLWRCFNTSVSERGDVHAQQVCLGWRCWQCEYHSLNVADKEMSIRCYGKAIEKMRAKGKTLPEPASQYSLLCSIFPSPPLKYSSRSQYPSDSPLIWADWKGVSFWQPQEYSDFQAASLKPEQSFPTQPAIPCLSFLQPCLNDNTESEAGNPSEFHWESWIPSLLGVHPCGICPLPSLCLIAFLAVETGRI